MRGHAHPAPLEREPSDHVNLATIGPLKVVMNQMLDEPQEHLVSALLEVIPLRSTPANTWGLSSVEGSPIRSAPQASSPSPSKTTPHQPLVQDAMNACCNPNQYYVAIWLFFGRCNGVLKPQEPNWKIWDHAIGTRDEHDG